MGPLAAPRAAMILVRRTTIVPKMKKSTVPRRMGFASRISLGPQIHPLWSQSDQPSNYFEEQVEG